MELLQGPNTAAGQRWALMFPHPMAFIESSAWDPEHDFQVCMAAVACLELQWDNGPSFDPADQYELTDGYYATWLGL